MQGLVFWMKDGIPSNELQQCMTPITPDSIDNDSWTDSYDVDVAPFWRYLSYKLQLLYDPMTGDNYNPLQLNYKWWQTKLLYSDKESVVSIDQIRNELYSLTMKFKSMAEIIYESNKTLNIVTTFNIDNGGSSFGVMGVTQEISQKSYNSLPDHVLCGMVEKSNDDSNNNKYAIDINAPCAVKELSLNGEITPFGNVNDDGNNDNELEEHNIWWVSSEYDEVVDVHDDDELYDEESDNPLLTPRGISERDNETKDDFVLMTDRKTL